MIKLEEALLKPFPWQPMPLDPPPEYRALREEKPVRIVMPEGRPAWLLSKYEDVRTILADPRASADQFLDGFVRFQTEELPKFGFIRMDDPEHARLRRIISKFFTVKRVEAMRPQIQKMVDDAIDRILNLTERPVDLVKNLTIDIPSAVLCLLLGVPDKDRAWFTEQVDNVFNTSDPNDPDAQLRAGQSFVALNEYITGLLTEAIESGRPDTDILGQLATSYRQDELSLEDAIGMGLVLIIAGFDTTASAAALGTLTLLANPDQLRELQEDPSLLPDAIEELLRYISHVNLVIVRTALEDIEIGGVTIPAGEGIIPLNSSANRDDLHFPKADTFDIHRKARDHLAFGYGVHQCLGQPLARLELNIIFETLFRRIPSLKLAVPFEEIPFKTWSRINGVNELLVDW